MGTAIAAPAPPEGSWMLSPERKAAWDYLASAMASKRSNKPASVDAYDDYNQQAPVTHTAILGSLERVYLLAPAIEEYDVVDFLGFAESVCFAICDHHRLEEDFIFPRANALTKTTVWQPVSDEHDLFIPPLFALWHYIRKCRDTLGSPHPSDIPAPWLPLDDIPANARSNLAFDPELRWDGKAVQRHMDSFMLDFAKHIPFEAESSLPENLRKASAKEIGQLLSDLSREAFKTMNLHVQLPLLWTHNDVDDIKHFTVSKSFLRVGLTWWFGARHSAWWRFSAHPENLLSAKNT